MPKGLKLQNLINMMDDEQSSGTENLEKSSPTAAVTSTSNGSSTIKHIPFPDTIHSGSEIPNELKIFLFSIFSAAMQFIHIYRTVFWQPETFINHTINFYLIDPYLVIFIVIMMSRRLIYCIMNKCLEIVYKDKYLKIYKIVAKYCYISVLALILGSCVMKIYAKHNYLSLFLLLYPIVVYTLIFGPKIEPFLRTSAWEIEGSYLNGFPMHSCSNNPNTVRDEIEILKNDFNNRFKQILFTSVMNAYYATVVPMFLAPVFIYYNVFYTTVFIIFVWLGGFTMLTVFCFPAKYCDILHRAALHLGQSSRLDNNPRCNNQQNNLWIKATVNTNHQRFYKLFNNPTMLYMILSTIQTVLVVVQIGLLFFSVEWHNILSLNFLTLTNYHSLFKIIRDYLVIQKVYGAESSIYQRFNLHYN